MKQPSPSPATNSTGPIAHACRSVPFACSTRMAPAIDTASSPAPTASTSRPRRLARESERAEARPEPIAKGNVVRPERSGE